MGRKYDFTDPTDAKMFRQKARNRGFDERTIEQYIAKKAQQQTPFTYTPEGDVLTGDESGADPESLAFNVQQGYMSVEDAIKENPKTGRLLSQMGIEAESGEASDFSGADAETIGAAKTALRSIQRAREEIKGPAGFLKLFGANTPFTPWGRGVESDLFDAVDVILRARTGAKATDEEVENYLNKKGPRLTDAPEVKKRKLDKIQQELEMTLSAMGIDPTNVSDPGEELGFRKDSDSGLAVEDIAKEETIKNVSGNMAEPGDLVRNPATGKLTIFGEVDDDPLMKKDIKTGFRVDNSLIRFLANSKALPIVGSLYGTALGGVAGGAVGAGLGELPRQGLQELLDPDKQDLSDAGKAVLTEMMVDALFGAGVGLVAKGGKLVLAKTGSEAAEQTSKGLLSEAVEETTEQSGKKYAGEEALSTLNKAKLGEEAYEGSAKTFYNQAKAELEQALKIPPSKRTKFRKVWGADFTDVLLASDELPKNATELAEMGMSKKITAMNELGEVLSKNSANPDEFIEVVNSAKKSFTYKAGEDEFVSFIDQRAMNELDKMIAEAEQIKEAGGEIPGELINRYKQQLQKAFRGKPNVMKGATIEASRKTKEFIEKLPKDLQEQAAIKGSNFQQAYGHFANEIGEKAMSKERGYVLFSFTDAIMSLNPKILASKKMVDFLTKNLDEFKRAKLFKKAADMIMEKGARGASGAAGEGITGALKERAKSTLSALIRLAQKTGTPMGLDESLAKRVTWENLAKQTAKETTRGIREEGMSVESAIPEEPGGGGGMNIDSAFSPEGAPLYK